MKTREPVLIVMSTLAALTAFFGGAGAITAVQGNDTWAAVCGLGALAVAAATTGVQFYVRGQVTPTGESVAPSGQAQDAPPA